MFRKSSRIHLDNGFLDNAAASGSIWPSQKECGTHSRFINSRRTRSLSSLLQVSCSYSSITASFAVQRSFNSSNVCSRFAKSSNLSFDKIRSALSFKFFRLRVFKFIYSWYISFFNSMEAFGRS